MKNFMDNATNKQRIAAFIAVIVLIIGGVVGAILLTSGPDNPSEGRTGNQNNNTGITSGPEPSSSETPTPTPTQAYIPKDEFDARDHAAQEATPAPTPTGTFDDGDDSGPDFDAAQQKAQQGTLAWCTIDPGETWEQRQAKMKPYFDTTSDIYENEDIDGIVYQRFCNFEAASDAQKTGTDQYTVYITVTTGFILNKGDTINGKMVQYEVTVGPNGITDIND